MRTGRKIDVPFRTQQFVILAAQVGSFHKAARALGVNHAQIIRSIDRLERDLGVKIFERTRQRFSVTAAGIPFVRELLEAVMHVERAYELTRLRAQVAQGPFRIGYSPYIHSRLVPVLETLEFPVARVALTSGNDLPSSTPDHFGASRVLLECGTTLELVERVLRGGLHAAFGVSPVLEADISANPIMQEPFSLAVSKNHRFAKQPSVLARELDGETIFFLPRTAHPCFFDRTVDYIESTGAKVFLRETMAFAHTMEIVAHNFGVALVPRSASRFSPIGVLFKPIADRLLSIETALFHPLDQREDRVQWFLHELLANVRRIAIER